MLCLQCVHEITRCFTFKQLCEQSDLSLRQYLGKPQRSKQCKEEETNQNDFSSSLLFDNFGEDSTSEDSDDDFKDDFSLLQNISENPNDEKSIAQKQLLKVAKSQKLRLTKRKLFKGGKAAGKFVGNIFVCNFRIPTDFKIREL